MARRSRAVLGWLGQVVAWLVILGVVGVLAVAVVVPRLAGATPYTVLTGSMEPTYPPGTLVVSKPVSADEIGTGDVITFQRESGKATVVTHRVVAVGTRTDGETVFTTRGDANNTEDEAPVRPVQVRGRVWYAVPYLGHVNNALTGSQRQVAVLGVSGLLIGYAAFMLAGALRERLGRGRRADGEPAPAPGPPAAPMPVRSSRPGRHRRQLSLGALAAVVGFTATVLVESQSRPGSRSRILTRCTIHRIRREQEA